MQNVLRSFNTVCVSYTLYYVARMYGPRASTWIRMGSQTNAMQSVISHVNYRNSSGFRISVLMSSVKL